MTWGDWAAWSLVLLGLAGGSLKLFREWAKSLGARLDKLEDCIEERLDDLSDRLARLEGPRYPPAGPRGR